MCNSRRAGDCVFGQLDVRSACVDGWSPYLAILVAMPVLGRPTASYNIGQPVCLVEAEACQQGVSPGDGERAAGSREVARNAEVHGVVVPRYCGPVWDEPAI